MRESILLIVFALICFALGYQVASSDHSSQTSAQVNTQTADFSSGTPTSGASQPSSSSGGFSSDSTNSTSGQTPTREVTNPFAYTPLPAESPASDIVETSPLTASRTSVQVDDSVTFSVTIKNQASYDKHIQTLCFESSDGNIGCVWGIYLAPGQTTTIQNVGTWVHLGSKSVWVTWSSDGINFYTPVNANSVTVDVLG